MRLKAVVLLSYLLIIPLVLGNVCIVASSHNDVRKSVKFVGDAAFPPFEYLNESGEPEGFNVDIIKAVMEAMDTPYTLILQDWDKTLSDVKQGRADAISGISYMKERTNEYCFSNPYVFLNECIVCRIGDTINTVEKIEGRRIALQHNSTLVNVIQKIEKEKKLNLLGNCIFVNNLEEAFEKLASGECDVVSCSNKVAQYIIHKNKYDNIETHPLEASALNYCVAGANDKQYVVDIFNEGLRKIKKNGAYSDITQKWFGKNEESFIERYAEIILISLSSLLLIGGFVVWFSRREVRKATFSVKRLLNEYYSTLRSLSVGVVVCSRQGEQKFINNAFASIFGIKDEARHLAKNLCFFKDPEITMDIKDRIRRGEEFSAVLKYDIRKNVESGIFESDNAREIYINLAVVQQYNDSGELDRFVLIFQDITENYLTTQKLKENKYKTSIAIKSGGLVQWDYDCRTKLYTIESNEQGGEKKTFTISEYFKLIHPDDLHIVHKFTELMDKRENISFSEDLRLKNPLKDGWLFETISGTAIKNTTGIIERYTGFRKDNTNFIELNNKLSESNKLLKEALSIGKIIPLVFNVREKKAYVTYSEQKKETAVFDLKANGVSYDFLIENIHPDDRNEFTDIINSMQDGVASVGKMNIRYDVFHKFINTFELNLVISSYDTEDRPYVISGYVQDITEKLKVAEELHKKEAFLISVLDLIPVPVHIKDYDNGGKYIYWNDASRSLLGDALGKDSSFLVDALQMKKLEECDKLVYDTGIPYTNVETITLLNGQILEFYVKRSVIWHDGRKMILVVRWDMSDQNRLIRLSKNLSLSIAQLNAFTWSYDFRECLIRYGDSFPTLGGDASRNETFTLVSERIHPEERESFYKDIKSFLDNGCGEFVSSYRVDFKEVGNYEWWEFRASIEEIETQDGDTYKLVHGLCISIGEHKQLLAELQRAKAESDKATVLLQEILKHIPCGIFIKDVEDDFRFIIVNDYFASFHNKPFDFFIGKRDKDFLSHSVVDGYKVGDDEALILNGGTKEDVYPISWNGQNYTVDMTKTLLTMKDGNRYIIGTLLDVTRRENELKELQEAKEKAEQSDRLKSAFLANMSHEIRTPLNAIVGFSEILVDNDNKEEKKAFADVISTNNELLLRLISDILDLSKIESGMMEFKPAREDIVDMFNETFTTFRQKVKNPDIEFLSDAPACKHCYFVVDKGRALQVGTNFITNSIKYTQRGYIKMGYTIEDDGITLWVEDTGIGIEESKYDKVFERFEKLDNFAQGTGLGMSICKAIMDEIGGRIGFTSTYGKGSRFWAWFPGNTEVEW